MACQCDCSCCGADETTLDREELRRCLRNQKEDIDRQLAELESA